MQRIGEIVESCFDLFYLDKESIRGDACYSKKVKVENFSTFLKKHFVQEQKKENDPK